MLLTPRDDEVLPWMRVLENILDVVDPAKMESSTGGEWRAAIGRCVRSLQGNTGKYPHLHFFHAANHQLVTSVAYFLSSTSAEVADCCQTQSASGSRRTFFRRSSVPMSRRSPTSGEELGTPGILIFDPPIAPTAETHLIQLSRRMHA
jgi:hypothetical protein